jgi:hypothetical protein
LAKNSVSTGFVLFHTEVIDHIRKDIKWNCSIFVGRLTTSNLHKKLDYLYQASKNKKCPCGCHRSHACLAQFSKLFSSVPQRSVPIFKKSRLQVVFMTNVAILGE